MAEYIKTRTNSCTDIRERLHVFIERERERGYIYIERDTLLCI